MSGICSLESSVINKSISSMSDQQLCEVILSLSPQEQVEILIKCDVESLDKIFKIKRENVENLIDREEVDSDTKRAMDLVNDIESKDNPTIDDYIKICNELKWICEELSLDNDRCNSDISSLEKVLDEMRRNICMYHEDLDESCLIKCREKVTHVEGLIRLRSKTREHNNENIRSFQTMISTITNFLPVNVE
jgi:hypothetical protein